MVPVWKLRWTEVKHVEMDPPSFKFIIFLNIEYIIKRPTAIQNIAGNCLRHNKFGEFICYSVHTCATWTNHYLVCAVEERLDVGPTLKSKILSLTTQRKQEVGIFFSFVVDKEGFVSTVLLSKRDTKTCPLEAFNMTINPDCSSHFQQGYKIFDLNKTIRKRHSMKTHDEE